MSYIGNPIISTDFPKDTFSGNGSTTAFTMSIAPASVNAVIVVVSGITQDPSTYTISGTTLTFSGAPPTGTSNISVRHLGVAGIPNVPSAASVGISALSATGTPSSSTYHRGDNTWATLPASGSLIRVAGGTLSAASAITVDSCFTSTYKNYAIYFNLAHSTVSSNSIVYLQFRASGSTNSSSSYTYQTNYINANVNAGTASSASSATAFIIYHNIDNNSPLVGQVNIMNPVDAVRTQSNCTLYGEDDGNYKQMLGFSTQTQNTSFDGFTITLSQGTLTGTYDVYGVAR